MSRERKPRQQRPQPQQNGSRWARIGHSNERRHCQQHYLSTQSQKSIVPIEIGFRSDRKRVRTPHKVNPYQMISYPCVAVFTDGCCGFVISAPSLNAASNEVQHRRVDASQHLFEQSIKQFELAALVWRIHDYYGQIKAADKRAE